VIRFSFLRNANYGDITQFAQSLQVSQLKDHGRALPPGANWTIVLIRVDQTSAKPGVFGDATGQHVGLD